MRVTVIFSDNTVYVDGVARVVEMPPHDANWHAIQWDGEHGDVEVSVGAGFVTDDPSVVAPFLAAWETAAPQVQATTTASTNQPATGVTEM